MYRSLRAPLATFALAACASEGGDGLLDAATRFSDDGGAERDGASGGADGGSTAGPDGDTASGLRYSEAHFAGGHNSYEGDERGTLVDQLEAGVRAIELDIHDNDFADEGYRVGHFWPGNGVDHSGDNPDSDALVAWLSAIASWSDANPQHAPITLLIDLKDPIHDDNNQNFEDGNPAHLNAVLRDAFGDRVLRAADIDGSFPAVEDLRGRVLAVMSGEESTRLAYRRDAGHNVAVAVNAGGRVIEVHDSGGDDLWYWTGAIEGGEVTWYRHRRYDRGRDPSVALSDDGLVVEVHNSHSDDALFYRVGQLGSDFEVDWLHGDDGLRFPGDDSGADPTVRFVDRGGLEVRELHRSENDGDHFFWDGTIDTDAGAIEWTRNGSSGETDEPLHDKTRDETNGYVAEVSTGSVGPYGDDTLRYGTGDGEWRPIRYEQVLFVEVQHGGSADLERDDLWFFAAAADSDDGRSWAEDRREGGGVARLWGFNGVEYDTRTPVNIPATDTPLAPWYLSYCSGLPCVE